MWWGEHLGVLERKNTIEGWEGWVFYPNDDVVTWPPIPIVENQHPSTQKPPPMRFQPSPAIQLKDLANQTLVSSCHLSYVQNQNYVDTWLLE